MNNIYTTSDFNLACYLMANGLVFQSIKGNVDSTQRCVFSLFIPEQIDIILLLQKWEQSETTIIRDVLFRSKQLKSELKRYFNTKEIGTDA